MSRQAIIGLAHGSDGRDLHQKGRVPVSIGHIVGLWNQDPVELAEVCRLNFIGHAPHGANLPLGGDGAGDHAIREKRILLHQRHDT